jgi:CBS domain-containing protein
MRRLRRTIEELGWTRDVPRLPGSEPVARAFELMGAGAHDCILVMSGQGDDQQLAGIFTSRDFLNRVAAKRSDVEAVPLEQVMTRSPRTLGSKDSVAFAINWMALEGFRNVPVVDADQVLGVLTVWDVMRQLSEIFDEIDATPRDVAPEDDISGVTMVDLGGPA